VARRTVLVVARPRPRPRRPAPPPRPTTRGVFPVAGPHSYGDPFGAPRKGYTHQGQDIVGAEGTPIVAPLAGTISTTDYQASAAGYYVVLDASDGHAYFFAHCQKGSTAVSPGAVVAAGAPICAMGHTGDASGPHLHFEEWVGGWRVDAGSHPVDPLPQLRAWDS
jgi:murein DD-endopeptidase MepM/ murein hydrolase activator NlpD